MLVEKKWKEILCMLPGVSDQEQYINLTNKIIIKIINGWYSQ